MEKMVLRFMGWDDDLTDDDDEMVLTMTSRRRKRTRMLAKMSKSYAAFESLTLARRGRDLHLHVDGLEDEQTLQQRVLPGYI